MSPEVMCLYSHQAPLTTMFNPLTPTVAICTAMKHPVPYRVTPSFVVIFDIRAASTLMNRAERQSARMSKITNDGLTGLAEDVL